MTKKLKIFLFNHRTWVYNLQYILFSVVLLLAVTLMDYYPELFEDFIPGFLYTRVELAITVLSSLSSGLLAISIFTFSSILAMLVFYSGNFSPRVLENFVGKKITMKVLGIFIGGFTYCLMSLNLMRGGNSDRLVIAGTVGIIYTLFCLIYLIRFIQTTIRSAQITHLVADIYAETLPVVTKEAEARTFDQGQVNFSAADNFSVISRTSGYFELFNTESAEDILRDYAGNLLIPIKTGDFVIEGQEIGTLSHDPQQNMKQLAADLLSAYEIHEQKIAITDYLYGLDKLKEIALMGLSPGINDPATAIHCVRRIATLMARLAATDEYHHLELLKNDSCIFYTSNPFSADLYHIFSPIANYGKGDAQLLVAVFEGIMIMSAAATDKNQKKLLELASEIKDLGLANLQLPSDQKHLSAQYAHLAEKIQRRKTE